MTRSAHGSIFRASMDHHHHHHITKKYQGSVGYIVRTAEQMKDSPRQPWSLELVLSHTSCSEHVSPCYESMHQRSETAFGADPAV